MYASSGMPAAVVHNLSSQNWQALHVQLGVYVYRYNSQMACDKLPTFQVLDESLKFHLTGRFDIRIMQVCIQHDNGEG